MELKQGDYLMKGVNRIEVMGICGNAIFLGYRNMEGKLLPFPPFATVDYIATEGWKKVEMQ